VGPYLFAEAPITLHQDSPPGKGRLRECRGKHRKDRVAWRREYRQCNVAAPALRAHARGAWAGNAVIGAGFMGIRGTAASECRASETRNA
jgi:hypothetical protein